MRRCPDMRDRARQYTLSVPCGRGEKSAPTTSRATSPRARAWAAPRPLDEVTMLVMPDIVTRSTATAPQMRDLQGKMIAHCRDDGRRMAILDAPDGMLPQEVLEWRMNIAGYDSKMAALYWPWIEVMDPITQAADADAAVRSHRRRVVARRLDARRPQGAGERGHPRRQRARVPDHPAEQGELNRNGINCIRSFPGRGIRDLGRAHPLERPRVALHQRPAAVQLRLGVDHGGHAVERVRAQRPDALVER